MRTSQWDTNALCCGGRSGSSAERFLISYCIQTKHERETDFAQLFALSLHVKALPRVEADDEGRDDGHVAEGQE